MATIFRPPVYSPRGERSRSRVPHSAQLDVSASSHVLLYLGQDKFFTGAGKAPVYDYPNPIGTTYRQQRFPLDNRTEVDGSEFWMLKDQFFGIAGQPPSAFQQPNPRGPAFPIDNRTEADGTEYWLLLATQPPFIPIDFPNPRGYGFPLENRSSLNSFDFWLLIYPFAQLDWPNPLIAKQPIENKTEVDPSEFWMLKDQFFGIPGQPPTYQPPPNPRGAPFPLENRTLIDATEFWLFFATQNPFNQLDWPNPKPLSMMIDNRTIADGTEFWLLKDQFFGAPGQPPSPFHQPNPWGARQPIDVRTWLQSLLNGTLAPAGLPHNLSDWPNPRKPLHPIGLRTIAEFNRLVKGQDTFFGGPGQPITIWPHPNPRGYPIPADVRTWLARMLLNVPIDALEHVAVIQVGAERWVVTVQPEPSTSAVEQERNAVDPQPEKHSVDVELDRHIVDIEDDD